MIAIILYPAIRQAPHALDFSLAPSQKATYILTGVSHPSSIKKRDRLGWKIRSSTEYVKVYLALSSLEWIVSIGYQSAQRVAARRWLIQ